MLEMAFFVSALPVARSCSAVVRHFLTLGIFPLRISSLVISAKRAALAQAVVAWFFIFENVLRFALLCQNTYRKKKNNATGLFVDGKVVFLFYAKEKPYRFDRVGAFILVCRILKIGSVIPTDQG
jgi:hypothetical protein